MKINFQIFQTTWGISMRFSAKLYLEKSQKIGFDWLSEKYAFGKTTGGIKLTLPPLELSSETITVDTENNSLKNHGSPREVPKELNFNESSRRITLIFVNLERAW